MSLNSSTVPQPATKRVKAAKTVKVSMMLPADLHRRVKRMCKAERRLLSPMLVQLVERGLPSPEQANTE